MTTFQNTILIVAFNYSNCVDLSTYFYSLYKPYFKEIIFYSDIPFSSTDNNIHFIDIKAGCFVHRIFEHFYATYFHMIAESDGVFYTMDDNIINVSHLWKYDTNKIIYPKLTRKPLSAYSGWHWDRPHGKPAITTLVADSQFQELSTAEFVGEFADYFYLPKRYWIDKLITLFSLYGRFNVFLELAIPSIIATIEPDHSHYSDYKGTVLWGSDRNKTRNYNYVKSILQTDLFLHPLKFKAQPEALAWLPSLFKQNNKCIVITTINPPTKQIEYYSSLPDWDLIVVADTKTPNNEYKMTNCIYLDIEHQKRLFPTLFDLIPERSYTRKMFGYLFAIKNRYRVIYDTDDDNQVLDSLDNYTDSRPLKRTISPGFVNVYNCYTTEHIWPRGIPPGHSSITEHIALEDISSSAVDIAVIQGLVNGDPDVDAYYRINMNSGKFSFDVDPGYDVILSPSSVCPFNTQNTHWISPEMFHLMYLPTTVTFRYTDILRGFVSLHQLWRHSKAIRFTGPTAYQERNEHDLHKDYESELPMYNSAERVIELMRTNPDTSLLDLYQLLVAHGIVAADEIPVLTEWLRLCGEISHHQ